jgi:hypothetical protein
LCIDLVKVDWWRFDVEVSHFVNNELFGLVDDSVLSDDLNQEQNLELAQFL